ncbi:chromatin remodeling complex Adenosinetriphosphatase [Naganishia albida]|nr:chromatin remodeling complex Adenosinetriphosphatase [Naganishia albida]
MAEAIHLCRLGFQNDIENVDQYSDIVPSSRDISVSPLPNAKASGSHLRNEIDANQDVAMAQSDEDDADDLSVEDEDGQGNGVTVTPSRARRQAEADRRREVKEQRKAQIDALEGKRGGLEKQKLADSMKRFQYLLGQTELFQHFVDIKKNRDPAFAEMLEAQQAKDSGKGKKAVNDKRHRKSEKEEDAELLQNEVDEDVYVYDESPPFVKGGKMRDYQVQGLNWMASLHHNGINGILADEMGLGKTLQTISFLGHLKVRCGITGPHLIVVPKSTLNNWEREIAKWVPGFSTLVLQGTREERAEMIEKRVLPQDFDIMVTSYEMCLREKTTFKKFSWEYIVIDEAHRIKNVDSLLSQIVRSFNSRGRLLITGTPLQNNLQELWALLNFILPDVFSSSEDFDEWFKQKGDNPEDQDSVVQQLHKVLRPFLLRRVKADVEHSLLPKKEINLYVGMSDMQRKWYKSLLEKDIDAVNGAAGKREGKTRLLNIVMQLRKCCNHPYLFDGAEPGPPYTTDEHLVDNAGKMIILDKLLKSMKEKGSRVLIFSQMSRVLDILEDYCLFRGHKYCRIDGGTDHDSRTRAIDDYNRPDSDKFIFLLTTRAGGLGINLVTADIVVLFDSDWNPQADLQAMDRAHRIGQTKQVYVFRFITQDAIEERIIERATQKLKLDQLVIQEGRAQQAAKAAQNKEDLLDMIQHGAEKIINNRESMTIDDDIDEIIRQGEEKTSALNSKYEGLSLDALTNFQSELSAKTWEGQDYNNKPKNLLWIEPAKRERGPTNYSVDQYYSAALKTSAPKEDKPKLPKAPKQVELNWWHFYPPRLAEYQKREIAVFKRENNIKATRPTVTGDMTEAEADAIQAEEQQLIDTAEPLTEEEKADKEEAIQEGFPNWSRREQQRFISACVEHGRHNMAMIAEVCERTLEDTQRYSDTFWQRYTEIPDYQKTIDRIEAGERTREKRQFEIDVLDRKIKNTPLPLQTLEINYALNKGKQYSEDEDRFLLVRMHYYGLIREDCYDQIKRDIGEWPPFRFDWFIKSRTPEELKRRGQTLLLCLTKEHNDLEKANEPVKKGGKKRTIDEIKSNGKSNSRDASPASTTGKGNSKKRKSTA